MHLKARWVGVAVGALAMGATAVPALAVAAPSVVGSYATVTPSALRTVDGDACQDLVQLAAAIDLQGIGNAVEAQGYVNAYSAARVYSELDWTLTYSITGPDNYYEDEVYLSDAFPTAQGNAVDEVCPSDFGHDRVTAGTYTMTWHLDVGKVWLKHPAEGSKFYETLWTADGTSTVEVAFSQTCLDARTKLKRLTKTLKKAKKAHNRKLVKKTKRKIAATKGVIENAC